MNFSMNNISKAVTSASRAAAVCATKANAETLTLEVAQASIENQNLSDIKTKVEYADTSKKTWVTGNQVIVTVSSHVRTMAPFLSGERSISQVITIEDSDQLVGKVLQQREQQVLWAISRTKRTQLLNHGPWNFSLSTNPVSTVFSIQAWSIMDRSADPRSYQVPGSDYIPAEDMVTGYVALQTLQLKIICADTQSTKDLVLAI